jgi:hypothetical protein
MAEAHQPEFWGLVVRRRFHGIPDSRTACAAPGKPVEARLHGAGAHAAGEFASIRSANWTATELYEFAAAQRIFPAPGERCSTAQGKARRAAGGRVTIAVGRVRGFSSIERRDCPRWPQGSTFAWPPTTQKMRFQTGVSQVVFLVLAREFVLFSIGGAARDCGIVKSCSLPACQRNDHPHERQCRRQPWAASSGS